MEQPGRQCGHVGDLRLRRCLLHDGVAAVDRHGHSLFLGCYADRFVLGGGESDVQLLAAWEAICGPCPPWGGGRRHPALGFASVGQRGSGSWLSVGGPAPLSALDQPLQRLACGLAPGAPGDHIAAGWFPGNAYLWQAAFPGKTRAR